MTTTITLEQPESLQQGRVGHHKLSTTKLMSKSVSIERMCCIFIFLVRSGETEAFAMIEVVQVLLRQQIKDLKQLIPSLSEDFEQTVKTIWLAYISIFEINYEEEGVKELLPSQIARRESQVSLLSTSQLSRRDSQISLALSGITDNDDMDLSENDLDFSLNQLADAALMVNHAGHLKKMGRRTAQLSNSLLILSLGILHHKIPLYTYDILR